jgi:hypothetical protein
MLVNPAVRNAPIAALHRAAVTSCRCAGVDLAAVLVIGDIADPANLVLDMPVPADPGSQLRGLRRVAPQVGDSADGLGGEALQLVETTFAAANLDDLGGVRKPLPDVMV